MVWQLQEAKQKFSRLVRHALDDGPQVVTLRGEEAVVVISVQEFRRLRGDVPDFRDFLLAAPDLDALDIQRPVETARRVGL
jgi:prevent-host-death family protein